METRDGSSVLGSLALRVVEVGRHGDDSILDGLSEVGLGSLLHLGEDHGADLLREELLALSEVVDLYNCYEKILNI